LKFELGPGHLDKRKELFMKIRYFLCIWTVLLAGLSVFGGPGENAGAPEEEYLAVFMEGKKVGYAIQSREVVGTKVTTTEKVSMTISRANVPVTINMTEISIETTDGKPLGFEAVQELSAMTMKVVGTVNSKGMVKLTTTSMGTKQKSEIEWPSGAVMAEGLRLLTLKNGLKEGTQYSALVFSPGMLQATDAKIKIGQKQSIDLLGRIVTLTEVTTTLNMPEAGQIVTTNFVDDDLRAQKSIVPVAGFQIEMVACPKEFALGENDVLDVVNKMFLASPQPLDNIGTASSATYYLSPTKDANLIIPSNDNQKVQRLENGKVVVMVKPVAVPAGARFPYKGKDDAILEATKPTRFVQSDRKEIIALARSAVGDSKDVAEAARKIEAFVAGFVEYKNLSVGYASAAEVAESHQGDCSEFAVLTAAMCQAVGIPAQVVVGVAYVKDFGRLTIGEQDRFENGAFGGHAWVQVYIDDKWVGLDAAFKSAGLGGYDPGHIALSAGNGNPEDFLNLVSTIGRFKIEKVIVSK
jgi:hypothetical protein